MRDRLSENGKKNIALEDLAALLKVSMGDTSGLYDLITELNVKGFLDPVKSSGTNGNIKYPLHKKYRITLEDDISSAIVENIGFLHPTLLKSGYLSSHPKEYERNKFVIDKLNSYLFSRELGEPVSRKERSFEIFGREKVLDDNAVKTLLRNLQITESELCFYDTPEYCFHDYIPERKDSLVLLICENKDIWFNIRRCMFENNYRSLFGVKIDGVVYGNGNKVSQKKGALVEYIKFMGNPSVKFLYWGDIDREGFDIYRRTREVNASLDIGLFVPGYSKMIERARNIEIEGSNSSKKDGMSFDDLIVDFSPEERVFLATIFEQNKLIPQGIISYTFLSER